MTAPLRELPPMRVTATVHQTAAVVARRASAQKVAESAPPRVQREVREERVPEAAKPAPVRPAHTGTTTNLTLAELAVLVDKQKRGQILDTTELDEDDIVSNAPVVLVSSQASLAARMLRRR